MNLGYLGSITTLNYEHTNALPNIEQNPDITESIWLFDRNECASVVHTNR